MFSSTSLYIRPQNFRIYQKISHTFTKNTPHDVIPCRCFVLTTHTHSYKYSGERLGNSPAKELKIPTPWGHIAAKQWGKPDGKPVIAAHGWQDNAGTFDTLAPLLPNDWNLVSVDLPGHGQSSHFPKGFVYYLLEHVGAIIRVSSFLKWQKFDYIGHSMGAAIGYICASVYPENIDHLVAIDLVKGPTMPANSPNLQRDLAKFFVERMRFEAEADRPPPMLPVEDAIKRVIEKQKASLTEESVKILMKRGAEVLPDGKVRFRRDRRLLLPTWATVAISTEQSKKLMEFMKCKLLIIKGKQGPWYEKEEVYAEFKELYKKYCKEFKYIEVEGTHHLHLNTPENVSEHIIEFINEK